MSEYLNAEEKRKVEEFRESIRLSYRKRAAEFGEPQSEEDSLRAAVRSIDGGPSPLELVIKKMEKEDTFL